MAKYLPCKDDVIQEFKQLFFLRADWCGSGDLVLIYLESKVNVCDITMFRCGPSFISTIDIIVCVFVLQALFS